MKDENIPHNIKQWYRNAFSGPKLENKNDNDDDVGLHEYSC